LILRFHSGILTSVGERKGFIMKEVKTFNNDKKNEQFQKKLKEKFISQVYPEFSSPVVYLRYKELKAETA